MLTALAIGSTQSLLEKYNFSAKIKVKKQVVILPRIMKKILDFSPSITKILIVLISEENFTIF